MYKIGITPPRLASHSGRWVKQFVQAAEAAGAESLWTGERPAFFTEDEAARQARSERAEDRDTGLPDPLDWLAYAAAASTTIKLATGIVLLPFHNPIVLAKRAATIDRLSEGRLLLGLGIGWNEVQFRALGVEWTQRGGAADEAIGILRALWRAGSADHAGPRYAFRGLTSDPKPARADGIPIIIGGSTSHGARRAGRLGDGYFPYSLSPDEVGQRVAVVRATAVELGRDPAAIEISTAPGSHKNSTHDVGAVRAFRDAGISRFILRPTDFDGAEPKDIERGVKRFRDDVLANL